MITVLFKKLNDDAKVPTRGSEFAAGFDLYSTEDYTLMPLERKLFKTGISIAIPPGADTSVYGRIAPRSGLAYKNGIDVMAGVIDEDYRGDVGVILINLGKTEFKVSKGDKIAQIIFESYTTAIFVKSDLLPDSTRGAGGFGSTDAMKFPPTGGFILGVETGKLVGPPQYNSDEQITWMSDEKKVPITAFSDDGDLIRIRSNAPKVVENVESPERKFTEDKPYHQTGKSSILDKWKEQNQGGDVKGYEALVKEREKSE